ncbi:hypothetical protein [Modicisalibacter coralii]|uniref:hypothetical protein n=1 Tax=Modicisalibacter coralii TaxID=2304602 RepID=UPI00100AA131|nr:hypothetical protein [Halomonas coralii]
MDDLRPGCMLKGGIVGAITGSFRGRKVPRQVVAIAMRDPENAMDLSGAGSQRRCDAEASGVKERLWSADKDGENPALFFE